MISELLNLALGLDRLMMYVGYVLLTGSLTFWCLVWPEGRSDRRLVALAGMGNGLFILSTILGPVVRLLLGHGELGEAFSPLSGSASLVRLAVLGFTAFFLVDLVRTPMVGWRRSVALAITAVAAATMVAQSNAVTGAWRLVTIIATSAHLLATAAWLGGLVALAAVLIPRENLAELDRLIPRFSRIATISVLTLVGSGAVHALSIAGGVHALVDSTYGLVLGLKVMVFAAMLVLGNHGRRYAARVAFRRRHAPENLALSSGVHALAVVIGAEVALAFMILATTSILVLVAP